MLLNRIAARLSVSLTAFVILMLAAFLSSYVFITKQAGLSESVDTAHTQAVLAQVMTSDALAAAAGVPTRAGDRAKQIAAFEAGLADLRQGRTGQVLAALDTVEGEWTQVKGALAAGPAQVGGLVASTRALAESLEAVMVLLEAEAESNVGLVLTLQGLAVGAVVALWAVMLFFTWRDIGVPLQRLVTVSEKMSTGDVETPIDATGLVEIRELAESFERLRLSIRTMLTDAVGGADLDGLDELDAL